MILRRNMSIAARKQLLLNENNIFRNKREQLSNKQKVENTTKTRPVTCKSRGLISSKNAYNSA